MLDESQRLRSAYKLEGEVDLAVVAGAEAALYAVAMDTPGEEVELDCADLTFIDASGVTMLLHVAARSGKFVHLVHLAPNCRRVFEILGLCAWFGIDEVDPRAGVQRLSRPA